MDAYGKSTVFLTGKCTVEEREVKFELSEGIKPIKWKDDVLVRNLIKSESNFAVKDTTFGYYKQFDWESESGRFILSDAYKKNEQAQLLFEEARQLALENNYKAALKKIAELIEDSRPNTQDSQLSPEELFSATLDTIKAMIDAIEEAKGVSDEFNEALENINTQMQASVDLAQDSNFSEAQELVDQIKESLDPILEQAGIENTFELSSAISSEPNANAGDLDGYIRAPELSDEFAGGSLDASKWYDHNPSWHGREPGYFSRNNVFIMDGKLYLCAKAEDLDDLPDGYHSYSTAAIQSKTTVK